MKIHAIQTGSFKVKQSFCLAKGHGQMRLVNMFLDRTWTERLPYLNWLIEHPEGLILIDTGETVRALQSDYYDPLTGFFISQNTQIFIQPEEEVGPQIKLLGFSLDEVRWVILTHLHQDHVGGLRYFPNAKFLISRAEFEAAYSFSGKMQGYMPKNWPDWFKPQLVDFNPEAIGPFSQSCTLTQVGDIHLIPTQGHSPGHMSVILKQDSLSYFFAGDASFNQQLMLEQAIDGVAPSEAQAYQTLAHINQYVQQHPTIYLPSHDADSGQRLTSRTIVGKKAL
jgi:N-acyl homoserine lactone hydrolase